MAQRALGSQAEREGSAANASAHKIWRLHKNGARLFGDARIRAAHDSSDADRAGLVRDHRHAGRKVALHAVERRDALACCGRTRDDAAAANFVSIIEMQGLSDFQLDVIGYIN